MEHSPLDLAPLKIALLGLGRYSGASPIPLHLAEALNRRHKVKAFLGSESLNVADWRASGLDIDVRSVYTSLPGALWSVLVRHRIRALARAINEFAPDVVLAPFFHLWHLLLVKRIRHPFVVFVHDPQPHIGLGGMVFHALERRLVRHAKHVVIHSSTFLPILKAAYGVDPQRISVVPIGPLSAYSLSLKRDSQSRQRESNRPHILFFGRLESYKGIDILLTAVPLIRRQFPLAVVSLIGQGGSAALLDRARRTPGVHLENRWVADSEVGSIFAQADMVVLPYTNATQSGVIPVAAAFALPVIATRTGGLSEQLCYGECGILIEPNEPARLAEAVVGLAADPERARLMGQALFDEYSGRRSWAAIADTVTTACRAALHEAG